MQTFKIILSSLFCVIGLSAQPTADTLFINGDIVTVDDKNPTAEAVAVANGRILYVGSQEGAMQFKSGSTDVVDLEGKTLMPGFIDPHTYLVAKGIVQKGVNVGPLTHDTLEDVLETLRKQNGAVLAVGFDPALMGISETLDMKKLDKVSTTVPIVVLETSGRIAYGNSVAFQKANITNKSERPVGGSWGYDEDDNLNGIAYGLPAIFTLIDGAFVFDYPAIARSSAKEYAKRGYTTVTDMGLGLPMPTSVDHIKSLRTLANDPDAQVRIQGYVVFPLLSQIQELSKGDNERFAVRGVAIWADGFVQGGTASLSDPYKDTKSYGKMNFTQEEMERRVLEARKHKIQVAIDADGDEAVAQALKAFENAQEDRWDKDPRFRVEHATVANENLLQRMHDTKATPSFTNLDLYFWGEAFRDKLLGKRRAKEYIDLAATAKKVGMKFSFNDSAPLAGISPLLLIQVGVTREMANGKVLNPEEKISVDDAIKAMTLWPAWQSFREKELGSIEVGKIADFVILDKNPKKVEPNTIGSIQVVNTYLSGKKI